MTKSPSSTAGRPWAVAADLAGWLAAMIVPAIIKTSVLLAIGIDPARVEYSDERIWLAEFATPLVQLPLLTWLLRRRGETWWTLGLRRPASWARLLGNASRLTLATLLVTEVVRRVPLLWGAPMPVSRYIAVRGHPEAILALLANTVFLVGITEELSIRGFLQTRLERLFGGRQGAGWALVVAAGLFGALHFQHGVSTVVVGVLVGVIYGWAYLRTRDLVLVAVAHSLHDTIRVLWLLWLG